SQVYQGKANLCKEQAALQARQAQASLAANNPATSSGVQASQTPAAQAPTGSGVPGVPRVNMSSQFNMAGQARPGMPLQGGVGMNGLGSVPAHLAANLARQMPMNGVSQGQIQGLAGQQRMPATGNPQADAHVLMQARRI